MAGKEAEDGYIDAEVCSSCHADVALSFRHTGMGRSIDRPTRANRIEDYAVRNTVHNRRSGDSYTMVERDGAFYQQRYRQGPDGRRTSPLEERVDYIIGSGDQARSYLHRDPEGRLIELPVTWYQEGGGAWGMTPGYDQVAQKDLHGAVSYECLFCHDAYPARGSWESGSTTGEPVFPASLPLGIDCQRCHGPGRAHVAAARSRSATGAQIRSAIVNPRRLGRDRQLEVCMQCHLSTSRSQDENVSRRFDRTIFSYRPGEPLGDYALYFDRADSEGHRDTFDIADAAYRLSFSACFRRSAMTCLTCHDPHVEEHGQAAQARYLRLCQGCHQSARHTSALPAKADCISCHMPRRRSQYAVHIVLTDHYIQRVKPSGDLTAPLEEPVAGPESDAGLRLFYPERLPHPEDGLYLAAARVRASPGDRSLIAGLEQQLRRLRPAQGRFYLILGEAYAREGDLVDAEHWLEEAHARSPRLRPILEQLVKVLLSEGRYQRARDLLQGVVDTPPADSALVTDLGVACARMGRLDEAEAALRRATAINPQTAQAWNLLGVIALERGNREGAEGDLREALRLQPDLAGANDNLGKLLMGEGDLGQAEYYLRRAVSLEPGEADAHHSLGLLQMVRKDYASSVRELQRAAELDPGDALTRSDLGDVLALAGEEAEAVAAYRQALGLEPAMPQASLGLGGILRRQGEATEARRLCRIALASADDSLREEALRCLQGGR